MCDTNYTLYTSSTKCFIAVYGWNLDLFILCNLLFSIIVFDRTVKLPFYSLPPTLSPFSLPLLMLWWNVLEKLKDSPNDIIRCYPQYFLSLFPAFLLRGRPLMIWGAEETSDTNFFSLRKPFFSRMAFEIFFLENDLRIFFLDFLCRPPRSLMVVP